MNVQSQHPAGRFAGVSARPIAELLECPPDTSGLLNSAAECLSFQPGEVVFQQGDSCRGLYVIISGEFLRKADRLNARVTLGPAHPGDIVELASALSGSQHTYTLFAIGEATLLLLPMHALSSAFDRHPPLRMQLLQELAREVSRAYRSCCTSRSIPARRRRTGDGTDPVIHH